MRKLYPNVFNIRYFRSDAIHAMAKAMLGQASAFLLALRRETAATAYLFSYPSPLKRQVSSKVRGIFQHCWNFIRHLTGDDAYERYTAHHLLYHSHTPLLSRQEFIKTELVRKWSGIRRCC